MTEKTGVDTGSEQLSGSETLRMKAVNYITKLSGLLERKPRLFAQIRHEEERFQRIISTLENHLRNIPTLELVALTANNKPLQLFLIQTVFLRTEDRLYRANSDRKDPRACWSDKYMSLVGSLDGRSILTNVKNHKGDPVRTKLDPHYKAAEAAEVLSIHGEFLDSKENKPLLEVVAEIADVVYNLVQLISLDKDPRTNPFLQKYLRQIQATTLIPLSNLFSLVIAKYHHRMYHSKEGKNAHQDEDELIHAVLQSQESDLLPEEATDYAQINEAVAQERINATYKLLDGIFIKLRSIMLRKFILIYEELDSETQHILKKELKNLLEKLRVFATITDLQPTILVALADLDLPSIED